MNKAKIGAEILLEQSNFGLWDASCLRETCRFLRKQGTQLSPQMRARLTREIMKGPPREQRANLKQSDWVQFRDREIALRLSKLVEGGVKLPKAAAAFCQNTRNPRSKDHPEEFSFYVSTGWVERGKEGIAEDFLNMKTNGFLAWVKRQKERTWDCEGHWVSFIKEHPVAALKLLERAAKRRCWPVAPWYDFLSHVLDLNAYTAPAKRTTAQLLIANPLQNSPALSLNAARWLEKNWKQISERERAKLWLHIWKSSLAENVERDSEPDIDACLNNPGGVLAGVLYDELAAKITKVAAGDNPGIPRVLRPRFNLISDVNDASFSVLLARTRMASTLLWLYRIDPEWTQKALLRFMDVKSDHLFNKYLWEGFLWSPRISPDLLHAIKAMYFSVLKRVEVLPERVRDHAVQLFMLIAIPPGRDVSTAEAKEILYRLPNDELRDAAIALRTKLEAAGEKAPLLWKKTLQAWFKKVWPSRARDKSPQLSEALCWMALAADSAFPDAIKLLIAMDLIQPEEWSSTQFHLKVLEEERGVVTNYPEAALLMVNKLVSKKPKNVDDTLSSLLSTIKKAKPVLADKQIFQRLAALVPHAV